MIHHPAVRAQAIVIGGLHHRLDTLIEATEVFLSIVERTATHGVPEREVKAATKRLKKLLAGARMASLSPAEVAAGKRACRP